jgi:8-oxo-dGTP diphosphatase
VSAPVPEAEIDVVAAILWRDGRFLSAERPEGKALAGWWEFPGGKVEPGEGLEAALVREVEEELSVRPTRWEFLLDKRHVYPHMTVRLHFFLVRAWTGALAPTEGQAVEWFTPGDLRGRPFLEVDLSVIEGLREIGPEAGEGQGSR